MKVLVRPSRRDGCSKVVFDGEIDTDALEKTDKGVSISIVLNSIYDTSKYHYRFDFTREEARALLDRAGML
jgi:hypothetical protein